MERDDEFGRHFIDEAIAVADVASLEASSAWIAQAEELILRIPQLGLGIFDAATVSQAILSTPDFLQGGLARSMEIYEAIKSLREATQEADEVGIRHASNRVYEKTKRLRTFFHYYPDAHRGKVIATSASAGGTALAQKMKNPLKTRNNILQKIALGVWSRNPELSVSQCAGNVLKIIRRQNHHWDEELRELNLLGVKIPNQDSLRRIIKRPT